MEELIWKEHRIAHLGSWKVFKSLRKKGLRIPLKIVKKVLRKCEVCARFQEERPRDEWHPALQSLDPGGVVYADFIGPLPPGKGRVEYVQCIVDSATRMGHATKH